MKKLIAVVALAACLLWPARSQAMYVDGMNVYQYVQSSPLNDLDSTGHWGAGRRGPATRLSREALELEARIRDYEYALQHPGGIGGYDRVLESQRVLDGLRDRLEQVLARLGQVPGSWRGHSDFPGGDEFDYNLEDDDPATAPVGGQPEHHFRNLPDSDRDVSSAISTCDKEAFERAMHRGQDYFSHWANGFRWRPGRGQFGHVFPEWDPRADDPNSAENVANQHYQRAAYWSQTKLDAWNKNCCKDKDAKWHKVNP